MRDGLTAIKCIQYSVISITTDVLYSSHSMKGSQSTTTKAFAIFNENQTQMQTGKENLSLDFIRCLTEVIEIARQAKPVNRPELGKTVAIKAE